MNQPENQRRGAVVGLSALAGLAAAAFSIVGITQHEAAAAQQQGVALTAGFTPNAADLAHEALVHAQTNLDHEQFAQDVALQQSIFYWFTEPKDNGGFGGDPAMLFPGSATDPENSIFNGAFSRFTEAQLVGQAIQQAQWDHMFGINQTLGVGGYETAIGTQLHDDLIGAGIPADSDLSKDLANLIDPGTLASASGFHDALTTLQGDLYQSAFSDVLGMFSVGDVAP